MFYQERDIVIFVYVGYGFCDVNFFSFYFNFYFRVYEQLINFVEIQECIQEKNFSFLVNIVVVCNVIVMDYNMLLFYQLVNVVFEIVILFKAGCLGVIYQGFFVDELGVIKVVNFFSVDCEYYIFILNDGGIFFNEILYIFQEVLGGQFFNNWSDICVMIFWCIIVCFE